MICPFASKCKSPVCVHRKEHDEYASCSFFKCKGWNKDCDNLIQENEQTTDGSI